MDFCINYLAISIIRDDSNSVEYGVIGSYPNTFISDTTYFPPSYSFLLYIYHLIELRSRNTK